MSVEQYIHGRLRYEKQLGTNGDRTPGIGCIARTDGVRTRDAAELTKRHPQYMSRARDSRGRYPILYSKELYSSGTMGFVSTMYIPPKDNDRATWIDHIFLAKASGDRKLLNPERWFGLPYIQEDPNSLDARGNSRWYQLSSLDTFPRGDFQLLPLQIVMDMWKLSEMDLILFMEALIDSTSFRERNLVVIYDLNGADCTQLPHWSDFGGDAEQYNHFRMEQLLCWAYHLLPYSFRRAAGYDTIYNLYSETQQIVFVPRSQLNITSAHQIQLYFSQLSEVGGMSTAQSSNASRLLGAGYLYAPGLGFANREKQSDAELFQEKGIIQDFLTDTIRELLSCGKAFRPVLERCQAIYEKIDDHLIRTGKGAFCVDIGDLREEIFRCGVSMIRDQDGLFKIAKNMLEQADKLSWQESARDNVELFHLLMANLRSRIDDAHRSRWGELLFAVLKHSEFPGQIQYLSLFAQFIDEGDEQNRAELLLTAMNQLADVTLVSGDGVRGSGRDWLVQEMLNRRSPVMDQVLKERVCQAASYEGLFDLYAQMCREALSLPDSDAQKKYCSAAWKIIASRRFEHTRENFRFVFADTHDLRAFANRDEMEAHLAALGAEMASQAEQLPIYHDVAAGGPGEYLTKVRELKNSPLFAAQVLRNSLRDKALFRDWLNNAIQVGVSKDDFLTAIEIAESECDEASKQSVLDRLISTLDKKRTAFARGEYQAWDYELTNRHLAKETKLEIGSHLVDNALTLRKGNQNTSDAEDTELLWFAGKLYAEGPERAASLTSLEQCCLDLHKRVDARGSMRYFAQLLQAVQTIPSPELKEAVLRQLIEPVLMDGTFLSAVAGQWKNENYDQFEQATAPWGESGAVRAADLILWHHRTMSAQDWSRSIVSRNYDEKTKENILLWCREYCVKQKKLSFLASVVQALGTQGATDQVFRQLVLPAAEALVPELEKTATRSDLQDFDNAAAQWEKDPTIQNLRKRLFSEDMIDLSWNDISEYCRNPQKNRKLLEDAGLLGRNAVIRSSPQPQQTMREIVGALYNPEHGERWFRLMCSWLRDALSDDRSYHDTISELCSAVLDYAQRDLSVDSPFTGSFLSSLAKEQNQTAQKRLHGFMEQNSGLGRLDRLVYAFEILTGNAGEGSSLNDAVFDIPRGERGVLDIASLICNGRLALNVREQAENLLSILARIPRTTETILLMTSVEECRLIIRAAADDERFQKVKWELDRLKDNKYWKTLGYPDSHDDRPSKPARSGRKSKGPARRAR